MMGRAIIVAAVAVYLGVVGCVVWPQGGSSAAPRARGGEDGDIDYGPAGASPRATGALGAGTPGGPLEGLPYRGVVIQVGSSLAYRGIPLQSAYCGAKHAIQGFTESVRCELLHDGSKIHLTMVQLPALNTPQFTMARNRLPRHPMPVAPIYQPEVAADGIVWASEHRRREVWVGASTPAVIVGNALVPTAADHFLARTGFDGQQSDMPPDGGPDYLFAPRPGDHGTHGRFGDMAKTSSAQLRLTKAMPDWAAGMLSAAAGSAFGLLQKRLGS